MPGLGEENVTAMIAEFARTLSRGTAGDMPGPRIARLVTGLTIRDLVLPSTQPRSTLCGAQDVHVRPHELPPRLGVAPEEEPSTEDP